MSVSKYNNTKSINIIGTFDGNKNLKNNFSKKNLFKKNSDLIKINFEKDYFEMDIDDNITELHCSELINFINSSKHIINLYLYNFPLSLLTS